MFIWEKKKILKSDDKFNQLFTFSNLFASLLILKRIFSQIFNTPRITSSQCSYLPHENKIIAADSLPIFEIRLPNRVICLTFDLFLRLRRLSDQHRAFAPLIVNK